MRALAAVFPIILSLGGCTCRWGAASDAPAAPQAIPEAISTRAVHPRRTDRGQPDGSPVIQHNTFSLALASDITPAKLRAAVQRAWEGADPDAVEPLPPAPVATCSRERRWQHGTDVAVLRVHLDDCTPDATDRSWRILLSRAYEDRPVRRGRGGRLRFSGLHRDNVWTPRGWEDAHVLTYERRGPAERPPPDDAAVRGLLPPSPKEATPFEVHVEHQVIGEVVLHRERVIVSLETRRCTSGTPASRVLSFTSRRRPPGHTPNTPLDAEVVSEVNSFGVLMARELQGRLSDRHPDELTATCAP